MSESEWYRRGGGAMVRWREVASTGMPFLEVKVGG